MLKSILIPEHTVVRITSQEEWEQFVSIVDSTGEYEIYDRESNWNLWKTYGFGDNYANGNKVQGMPVHYEVLTLEEFLMRWNQLLNGTEELRDLGDII